MRHSPARLSRKGSLASLTSCSALPKDFAGGLRLCWPRGGGSVMASKRHASPPKQPDGRGKKAKGGEEDDAWSSTLAALKTAPKEKPPATIDGLCPLSMAPGAQVRVRLGYPVRWGWGNVGRRDGGVPWQSLPC